MSKAECPSCGAQVNVNGNPRVGQRYKCKQCDTELQVVWLDPFELDWPFDDDDEDFEDDEDY